MTIFEESSHFISQEKALKYDAFDLLDDKEEDINIDFEHKPNEIEIIQEEAAHYRQQPSEQNKLEMIQFEKSISVEDLNESKDKNPNKDVFI